MTDTHKSDNWKQADWSVIPILASKCCCLPRESKNGKKNPKTTRKKKVLLNFLIVFVPKSFHAEFWFISWNSVWLQKNVLSIASESRKLADYFLKKKKNMHMIFCSVDKHIANAQGENLCGEITAETILSNRVLHLLNELCWHCAENLYSRTRVPNVVKKILF